MTPHRRRPSAGGRQGGSSAAGGAATGAAADAASAGTDMLQVLHDRLAEQVAALRSGQDWQRWLATAARFHTYSTGREGVFEFRE